MRRRCRATLGKRAKVKRLRTDPEFQRYNVRYEIVQHDNCSCIITAVLAHRTIVEGVKARRRLYQTRDMVERASVTGPLTLICADRSRS
jgi:hypothetical protein